MTMQKNLTQEEMASLESCQSEEEWNALCNDIKNARDGQYPPDWWPKVKLSGLGERVASKWGSKFEVKVSTFAPSLLEPDWGTYEEQ